MFHCINILIADSRWRTHSVEMDMTNHKQSEVLLNWTQSLSKLEQCTRHTILKRQLQYEYNKAELRALMNTPRWTIGYYSMEK